MNETIDMNYFVYVVSYDTEFAYIYKIMALKYTDETRSYVVTQFHDGSTCTHFFDAHLVFKTEEDAIRFAMLYLINLNESEIKLDEKLSVNDMFSNLEITQPETIFKYYPKVKTQ